MGHRARPGPRGERTRLLGRPRDGRASRGRRGGGCGEHECTCAPRSRQPRGPPWKESPGAGAQAPSAASRSTCRARRGCGRHRAPPRPGRRPAPCPVPAARCISFTKKQKPQHLCFPKHAKRAGETAAWPHRRGEPRAASVLGGRGPVRTAQPLTPASQMPSPGSLSPSCRQSMKMTI